MFEISLFLLLRLIHGDRPNVVTIHIIVGPWPVTPLWFHSVLDQTYLRFHLNL